MLAEWCVVTGFDDQVYKRLTRYERDAFYQTAKRIKNLK